MSEKQVIFYFSATGNSLAAARTIAAQLPGVELHSIVDHAERGVTLERVATLGFVFPTYSFGLPMVVRRFIERSSFAGADYTFAVATHAGLPVAVAAICERVLAAKGLSLDAAFTPKMPRNYIPMGRIPATEEAAAILEGSQRSLDDIARRIAAREKVPSVANAAKVWFSGLMNKLFSDHTAEKDRSFTVGDDCTSCGVCAKVCPVKNIALEAGRPVWQHRCACCMACIMWCPVKAIGWRGKEREVNRYHHPAVKASDLFRKGN